MASFLWSELCVGWQFAGRAVSLPPVRHGRCLDRAGGAARFRSITCDCRQDIADERPTAQTRCRGLYLPALSERKTADLRVGGSHCPLGHVSRWSDVRLGEYKIEHLVSFRFIIAVEPGQSCPGTGEIERSCRGQQTEWDEKERYEKNIRCLHDVRLGDGLHGPRCSAAYGWRGERTAHARPANSTCDRPNARPCEQACRRDQ